MTCLHPAVLIWWRGEFHAARCQECGHWFQVAWVEHAEPSEETNWEWGALVGAELITNPEEED